MDDLSKAENSDAFAKYFQNSSYTEKEIKYSKHAKYNAIDYELFIVWCLVLIAGRECVLSLIKHTFYPTTVLLDRT